MLDQNLIVGLIVLAAVVLVVYMYAPKFSGLLSGLGVERFSNHTGAKSGAAKGPAPVPAPVPAKAKVPAPVADNGAEKFTDYASVGDNLGPVPMAASNKPQGCYPREQLNPTELLPSDPNSQWAQVNPQGAGDIQGKNFLSAGALIGINTIGQSLRNSNLQLRAEPPCPQVQVSPWMQSTIEPDLTRRPLE